MPYNPANEERKIIAQFEKNSRGDKIQLSTVKNKNTGHEQADIRLMYIPEGTTELRPTPKGVRFSTELVINLVKPLISLLSADDVAKVKDYIDSLPPAETTEGEEVAEEHEGD